MDLQRRGEPIRTVITPVSPVEADRLVRVLNALDQSMFDYKPGMIVSCMFRARNSSGERTIKVGPRPTEHSHIVAGLVDEICEVGFVDVAAAIESADYAQELMAQGANRDAIWPNCRAIEMFDAWWMRYPQRYNYVNIDLFKDQHSFPEVEARPIPLTDEEYRQVRERIKAGGDAATTIAEVSAKSFRDELSLYFSVRREGQNVTSIAQIRKNDMRLDAGKSGIVSSIPPKALEILRDPDRR
ncbi:MAG TPA: hypothetical protein VH370_00780 [Humisphaera sp.]|nr:hypothetical protein [Humisphaera sp.]